MFRRLSIHAYHTYARTHAHWSWSLFCQVVHAYMYTHSTHVHWPWSLSFPDSQGPAWGHTYHTHTRTHTYRDHYAWLSRPCWWTDHGPCRAPRTCSRWRRNVRTRRSPPPGWCRPRRPAAPRSENKTMVLFWEGLNTLVVHLLLVKSYYFSLW